MSLHSTRAPSPLRILILDDDPSDAERVERALKRAEITYVAIRGRTREELVQVLESFQPHIVLSDCRLASLEGCEVLSVVRELHPDLPVIFVTDAIGDEAVAELIASGARDCLLKDRLARLGAAVRQVLDHDDARRRCTEAEERLRENETLLAELQAVGRLGVWKLDLVDNVLHWSDGIYRLFEIEPRTFGATYESFLDAVHPDDRDRVARAYSHSLTSREDYSIDHRLLMPDGRIKWVQERVATRYDEDGRPLYSAGTTQDISERRQSEEQLRLASLIIERSPVVLFRWEASAGWPVAYVSANIRQWGYSPEELMSGQRAFSTLIHPEDLQRTAEEVEQNLAAGLEDYRQHYRIVTAAGEPRWIEDHTTVQRDADGRLLFLQGIVNDVHDRKLEELALKARTRRLQEQGEALDVISRSAALAAGDVDRLAREVTELAAKTAGVERANVWLFDETESELRCIDLYEATPQRHSSGQVLTEGQYRNEFRALKAARYVDADDAKTDPRTAGYLHTYLEPLGITSMLDALIELSDRHLGLLCLEHVDQEHRWEHDEIEFACRLADKIGLAIGVQATKRATDELQQSLEQIIHAIVNTVEARDPYTAGHQQQVAELAVAIAREMGLPAASIHGLDLASRVHDVGKIRIPAEILNKPGRLTPVEIELVRTHAQAGYDILKDIHFPWPIAEMVLQHHERLDGSGYPQQLKGDQILLESRILAVADVMDAMATHRPYRPALGVEAALAEIAEGRGSRYDAAVVDACTKVIREKDAALNATGSLGRPSANG